MGEKKSLREALWLYASILLVMYLSLSLFASLLISLDLFSVFLGRFLIVLYLLFLLAMWVREISTVRLLLRRSDPEVRVAFLLFLFSFLIVLFSQLYEPSFPRYRFLGSARQGILAAATVGTLILLVYCVDNYYRLKSGIT